MLSIHSASLSLARAAVPTMTTSPLMGKAYAETMPGVTAPMGFFDPMGLSKDKSEARLR